MACISLPPPAVQDSPWSEYWYRLVLRPCETHIPFWTRSPDDLLDEVQNDIASPVLNLLCHTELLAGCFESAWRMLDVHSYEAATHSRRP